MEVPLSYIIDAVKVELVTGRAIELYYDKIGSI